MVNLFRQYRNFFVDYINNKIGLVVVKLSSMIVIIILTRLLGLENFGVYTIFLSLSYIVSSVSLLGIPNAIIRFISEESDNLYKYKVLKFLLLVYFFIYLFVSTVFILFSEKISIYLLKSLEYSNISIYAILNGLFIGLSQISIYIIQGLRKFDILRNIDFVSSMVRVITVSSLAYIYGLDGAIIGTILSMLFYWFYNTVHILYIFKRIFIISLRGLDYLEVGKYTIAVTLNYISLYSYTWLDTLTVSFFLFPEHVAIYKVASSLIGAISTMISYHNVLAPRLVTWNISYIRDKITYILGLHIILIFPFVVLINIFPEVIVAILYGEEFMLAADLIKILSINLILAVYLYINQIFVLKDIPKYSVIAYTVLSISNLISNIILIPKYNIFGAVYASVISYITTLLTSLILFYRFLRNNNSK